MKAYFHFTLTTCPYSFELILCFKFIYLKISVLSITAVSICQASKHSLQSVNFDFDYLLLQWTALCCRKTLVCQFPQILLKIEFWITLLAVVVKAKCGEKWYGIDLPCDMKDRMLGLTGIVVGSVVLVLGVLAAIITAIIREKR